MKTKLLSILLIFSYLNIHAQIIEIEATPSITINKKIKGYDVVNSNNAIIVKDIDTFTIPENNRDIYILKKQNKFGTISKYGNQNIPLDFDKIESLFREFWLVEKENKVGLYDIYSGQILKPVYDKIKILRDPVAYNGLFAIKINNKYGVANEKGIIIAPITYDSLSFNKGYLQLTIGNRKHYLIDDKVNDRDILIDKTFQIKTGDYMQDIKTFFIYQEGDKLGILDDQNKIILAPKYDDITASSKYSRNILIVNYNGKYGGVDINDNQIIPFMYENLTLFCIDKIVAKKNGEYGVINYDNKILFPFSNHQIIMHSGSFNIKKEDSYEEETYDCNLNKQN